MIAKSDLIILVCSASALAVGVYRWQSNVNALSQPAVQQPVAGYIQQQVPQSQVIGQISAGADAVRTSDAQPQVIEVQASAIGEPIAVEDTVVETTASVQTLPEPAPVSEPLLGTYTVQNGDILGRIALRLGTTVRTLRDINGIQGSVIRVGQEIRYPQQVAN